MNPSGKYGLQLRTPIQPKKPSRPPRPPPPSFQNDEEDDVEGEIARQASKKKSHRDVEQQHKEALEQDPSIFDYDGVYDEMKGKTARPLQEDRIKREPKYIGKLMQKAKIRQQEQEIVYERQLAKERNKEDHLYADKEKFVTAAYKKKLAEQAKWLEEERLRELREEANDVTKKSDMSDFYRNLLKKNVAFGANSSKTEVAVMPSRQHVESEGKAQPSELHLGKSPESTRSIMEEPRAQVKQKISDDDIDKSSLLQQKDNVQEPRSPAIMSTMQPDSGSPSEKTAIAANIGNKTETTSESIKGTVHDHKQNQEALAAAKERYLARKRMREG